MRTRLPVVPLIGIAIVVAQGCSSTSNDLGTGSPAPGGPNEGFGGGGVDASSGGVGFFGDGASGPIDVDAAVVSGLTVNVVDAPAADACSRSKLTPEMAPLATLVGLVLG